MIQRVGLVGCVKTKATSARRAKDLYISPLFKGRRAYVEASCDRWYILSAKHGLVDPEQVLEPYDVTLDIASARERRAWNAGAYEALRRRLGELEGLTFEAHAGSSYLDFGLVEGLLSAGGKVVRPAQSLGLFEQQSFYASGKRRDRVPGSSPQSPPGARSGGKYAPLGEYLGTRSGDAVTLSYKEMEEIVGRLPASARNHRAWWANDESHVQARAWLQAGWFAETVDFGVGRVTFRLLRVRTEGVGRSGR
jgi:hypothetical protein